MTPGDDVEDMFILLSEIKQNFPFINAVSSDAIASDYQRFRVESVCSRLGHVSLAYLWKQDQTLLFDEMIEKGIVALIIKVVTMGLVPAKHLGKELAELQSHLLQMKEASVCMLSVASVLFHSFHSKFHTCVSLSRHNNSWWFLRIVALQFMHMRILFRIKTHCYIRFNPLFILELNLSQHEHLEQES
ncbi:diphthine--ammonia ligase-like [Dioscorea cayenensis subsp. rotundata]|uniref:Diphthine--ammonia ligase n=1 Tax=Dioscorea cayennensis subsp. rotundata TaxID=55577 RepID=A0AB40AP97_DIOCR|nr:diphthine--ammonia ligase-like [Dioscorea cayenensis subsp. rotundata]